MDLAHFCTFHSSRKNPPDRQIPCPQASTLPHLAPVLQFPCKFMPHYHGRCPSSCDSHIAVDITATYPTGPYPDFHFPPPRRHIRYIPVCKGIWPFITIPFTLFSPCPPYPYRFPHSPCAPYREYGSSTRSSSQPPGWPRHNTGQPFSLTGSK